MLLHFVTLLPWPLTFDLVLIGGRGIVMEYLCAKFGDFSFSRFSFIVRTDRQTESQRRMYLRDTRRVNIFSC